MSCDTCTHNGKSSAPRDVEELPQGASSPAAALAGGPAKVFAYAPTWQHDTSPAPAGATRYEPKGWTRLSTSEEPLVESINILGRSILNVKPGALELLAEQSIRQIQHYFRRDHLEGWRRIVLDPTASRNDRYVALTLLQNAIIAARGTLPACQDTGTAIVLGKKGENVWTDAATTDEEALSHGIWRAYTQSNLRYSQTAALDMTTEVATGNNLPAQIDLLSTKGSEYKLLTIAKGGGSANKAYLYQETKALLNAKSLRAFIRDKLKSLGTSACPPYHLALVVGGTSAETTMKTVKLASCRYYDDLPFTGDKTGRAFRDAEWEKILMEEAEDVGLGSQFGGRHFAIQARVIRLPRHGASCPVGLGVSCSADRQILGKITEEGVFIETLEHDPAAYLPSDAEIAAAVAAGGAPEDFEAATEKTVKINLNDGMEALRATLSKYPICTRLSLTGTLVVARDIAHAKLQERLDRGEPLPDYIKNCIIYYAGPAKTPEGYASGSFGPTTAGRMDAYVNGFMEHGGGFVTLAKGNRTKQVTEACKKHGGFYLGSIGGTAAALAEHAIKKVEVLEYPELGMEAVWRIDVVDFPAFIIVDDKGNDFFEQIMNKKA